MEYFEILMKESINNECLSSLSWFLDRYTKWFPGTENISTTVNWILLAAGMYSNSTAGRVKCSGHITKIQQDYWQRVIIGVLHQGIIFIQSDWICCFKEWVLSVILKENQMYLECFEIWIRTNNLPWWPQQKWSTGESLANTRPFSPRNDFSLYKRPSHGIKIKENSVVSKLKEKLSFIKK